MKITGRTDTGMVRKTNQDDFAFGNLPDGAVWAVVCDGMGGANGGSVASTTAVKTISERLASGYSAGFDGGQVKKLLSEAVEAANVKVFKMSHEDPVLQGMGTTVVACFVLPDKRAFIVHAGDSRAYLIRDFHASQLTRDHSIVQEMVESGELTPDEAKIHPQKNIITRALGVEQSLNIDFSETSINDGDAVLICTDGLSNHTELDMVENAIKLYGYEKSVEELIQTANDNGGSDNITVVFLYN